MNNKYEINYILIFIVLTIIPLFFLLLAILIQKGILFGVIMAVIFIGLGISQIFIQRVKSVTVDSAEIIIEYRKTIVKISNMDIKKIEHYKHGLFTERIYVYSQGYIYEIPFDLKGFQDMCRNIYTQLSKINMEQVADEWFQKKFGKVASSESIQ